MNSTNIDHECIICDLLTQVFGIYSIILIVVATFGNAFSSYICYRLGKRNKTTFKILSYIFVFDALTLYTWLLDIFLKIVVSFGNFDNIDNVNIIESLSVPSCKIFTFNQYFTLQSISWLLVYLLIHQNIQLYFPHFKYNVKYVCLSIIVVIFILNSHILIFAGKIEVKNILLNINGINQTLEKQTVNCFFGTTFNFYTLWPMWDQVHLYIYSFVPFVLMIACNILTIFKLFRQSISVTQKSKKHFEKKRNLSILLVAISFCFILVSLTQVILFGYFFGILVSNIYTALLLPAIDIIAFTYIGLTFMIYFFSNKVFRHECYNCVHQFKKSIRFGFYKFLFSNGIISETKYADESDIFHTQTGKTGVLSHTRNTVQ